MHFIDFIIFICFYYVLCHIFVPTIIYKSNLKQSHMTTLLKSITGTRNIFINAFVTVVLTFIAFTLIAVAFSCFNDLQLLNRSF